MKAYFIEKVSAINYRIALDENGANSRLANEARNILLLPQADVPEKYKNEFSKLMDMINTSIENLPVSGLGLSRFNHIYNKTAVKYIKLLIDIEHCLKGF
jgi:hypothetical protein